MKDIPSNQCQILSSTLRFQFLIICILVITILILLFLMKYTVNHNNYQKTLQNKSNDNDIEANRQIINDLDYKISVLSQQNKNQQKIKNDLI